MAKQKKMTTAEPEYLLTKFDESAQARVEKFKNLQDGMRHEPTAFSVAERAVNVDDALEETLNDLNTMYTKCMYRLENDHGDQLTVTRFKVLQKLGHDILDRANVDAYSAADALRRQQAACYAKAWADEHDVHELANEVNRLKPGVAKPVFNVLTAKAVELVDADKLYSGKERLYRLGEQLEALTPVVFACVATALRADEEEVKPKRRGRRG